MWLLQEQTCMPVWRCGAHTIFDIATKRAHFDNIYHCIVHSSDTIWTNSKVNRWWARINNTSQRSTRYSKRCTILWWRHAKQGRARNRKTNKKLYLFTTVNMCNPLAQAPLWTSFECDVEYKIKGNKDILYYLERFMRYQSTDWCKAARRLAQTVHIKRRRNCWEKTAKHNMKLRQRTRPKSRSQNWTYA